jgi:hypothetical protein
MTTACRLPVMAVTGDTVNGMTVPTNVPSTVDELRQITDPVQLIHTADAYIAHREADIRDARALRDAAIGALAREHGPAAAARMSGRSVSTVKIARGRA